MENSIPGVEEPKVKRVLIIGGGRWAVKLAEIVLEVAPSARIGIVSRRNTLNVAQLSSARVDTWQSLEAALDCGPWSHGIVANLPAEHFATARRLLEARIPTLVEKPVAPTLVELRELVELAAEKAVTLAVGHQLPYLEDVATLKRRLAGFQGEIEMWWHENPRIHRDGSARVPDLSSGPVTDYFPHLLSLLGATAGIEDAAINSVDLTDEGVVTVGMAAAKMVVRVRMSRTHGPCRGLAFMTNAGRVEVDLVADPPRWSDWPEGHVGAPQRPLQRELAAFLTSASGADLPNTGAAALDIVRLTEAAQNLLAVARGRALRKQIHCADNGAIAPAILDAIREALVVKFADLGLIGSVKDANGADRWANAAWKVVQQIAGNPFARATGIAASIGSTQQEYALLSDAIAGWEAGQDLMMRDGSARKYWTNTIAPILRSGAIHDAIDNRPAFPFRIGLYPGLSCMFHCSFCGRAGDARYDRGSAATGYAHFVNLIDAAPRNNPGQFYISGGLEPLTNPHIGDIISAGAARGFKMSLYTNALMLTPALLDRQPGLLDLDVLRVSLYGTDAPSALAVTRHPRSFDQVIENVVRFLRLREERGSPVLLGFNHVFLPGRTHIVGDLGNLLARVKEEADTRRGIDFLTLREDYTVDSKLGLSKDERDSMRHALSILAERTKPDGDLAGLAIDLGYALDALVADWPAHPLAIAREENMRPSTYPQVSVVVDMLGDVYAYREAGFPERPGADRYIIGRLGRDGTMLDIVTHWVSSMHEVEAKRGDAAYCDAFDHVVTLVLDGATKDIEAGFPPQNGPVAAWRRLPL